MRRHWHHHTRTAYDYFEWQRRGIVGRIAHYIAPSPVAVVWLVAVVVVCAAIALATLTVELPGGW